MVNRSFATRPLTTGDELERVLGSMARKEGFETSPAAYLVACAKRRRWLAERVSATDQHA